MGTIELSGLSKKTFERLRSHYRRRWKIDLAAADSEGAIRFGKHIGKSSIEMSQRKHAIAEAFRWGEPTPVTYSGKRLIWAAPLMMNANVVGGLIAFCSERKVLPNEKGSVSMDIRQACYDLRHLAETENLTNAALLTQHRLEYQKERQRAEAIHDLKTRYFYSIREVYLREEPALIASMRKGNRNEARGILNRILVGIYHLGGDNLNVIKSFLMELVVTMSRTAVEAGGDPQKLLGANFSGLSELSKIITEEELSHWLTQRLELIMDAIHRYRHHPSTVLLHTAMKYLAEHYHEDISRSDVADVANLSPSHFSRLINRELGKSFTDLLNQLRVDRAAELLLRTEKDLLQIAMEVGFNDQSYFTKVFRRHTKLTPRDYRRAHQSPEN
jgi:AraC-like DNA-binding protein